MDSGVLPNICTQIDGYKYMHVLCRDYYTYIYFLTLPTERDQKQRQLSGDEHCQCPDLGFYFPWKGG